VVGGRGLGVVEGGGVGGEDLFAFGFGDVGDGALDVLAGVEQLTAHIDSPE